MTTITKWCAAGLTACIWSLSFNALADDSAALKKKLASIRQFSAHFEQTVTDAQGKPLQNGSGEMVLQRPDHFRWEAKKPDDNLILSDGKAVWLYDPFVEQVTVMSLSKAVVNTPFLLISSTDDKIWKNYLIDQEHDSVIIMGGQYNKSQSITLSPQGSENSLYAGHWMFTSGKGLTAEGLYKTDMLTAMAEQKMLSVVGKLVVLVDSSKIGERAGMLFSRADQIDMLITGKNANLEILQQLEAQGVSILRV